MADSQILRILKAIEARLKLETVTVDGEVFPRPPGLTVLRGRITPLELPDPEAEIEGDVPATLIAAEEEESERAPHRTGSIMKRVAKVSLMHVAQGEPAEDVVDPLRTWGTVALMSDERLGGLVNGIEEVGATYDREFYHVPIASVQVDYLVEFHTRARNPEKRS